MASYASNSLLNIAANAATASAITVRLHTGTPGNSGTANQVSGASVSVAANGWTAASGGVSETTADTSFGVLSATASTTVTHYSLWQGSTFLGWADLTSSVTVAANEAFSLVGGTVEVQFSRS